MNKFINLFIFLMLSFSVMCDNYNIVEPRYFSNEDLVEFPVGNPNNSNDNNEGEIGVGQTPTDYELTPFWNSASKDTLFIQFTNPKDSYAKLLILKWNGSVFETLMDRNITAGTFRYDYNAKKFEKRIYGISLQLDSWLKVLWFEIK